MDSMDMAPEALAAARGTLVDFARNYLVEYPTATKQELMGALTAAIHTPNKSNEVRRAGQWFMALYLFRTVDEVTTEVLSNRPTS